MAGVDKRFQTVINTKATTFKVSLMVQVFMSGLMEPPMKESFSKATVRERVYLEPQKVLISEGLLSKKKLLGSVKSTMEMVRLIRELFGTAKEMEKEPFETWLSEEYLQVIGKTTNLLPKMSYLDFIFLLSLNIAVNIKIDKNQYIKMSCS